MPLAQEIWRKKYDLKFEGRSEPPAVFHIGYHKTGTTFVQQNVLPQLNENQKFQIFSNEGISGYDFEDDLACGNLIAGINPDAKIIVTIRSQVSMYSSYYWLYVKSGGVLPLEKFIDECIKHQRFDYHAMYQALLKNFKADRILVLPFELLKNQKKEFLDQYLSFIFGDVPEGIEYDVDARNSSPSLFAVNFVRVTNKLIGGIGLLRPLRSFIAKRTGWIEKLFCSPKGQVKDAMTPEIKAKIENAYKNSNQEMQKHLNWDLSELGY